LTSLLAFRSAALPFPQTHQRIAFEFGQHRSAEASHEGLMQR
jgi:hypothetical protein